LKVLETIVGKKRETLTVGYQFAKAFHKRPWMFVWTDFTEVDDPKFVLTVVPNDGEDFKDKLEVVATEVHLIQSMEDDWVKGMKKLVVLHQEKAPKKFKGSLGSAIVDKYESVRRYALEAVVMKILPEDPMGALAILKDGVEKSPGDRKDTRDWRPCMVQIGEIAMRREDREVKIAAVRLFVGFMENEDESIRKEALNILGSYLDNIKLEAKDVGIEESQRLRMSRWLDQMEEFSPPDSENKRAYVRMIKRWVEGK